MHFLPNCVSCSLLIIALLATTCNPSGAKEASPAQGKDGLQKKELAVATLPGNFTFDPPVITTLEEGGDVKLLVTPAGCYADYTQLNLTASIVDLRVANVTEVKPLRPGTPSGVSCPVPRPGEDISCWRFLVTIRGNRLGMTAIKIIFTPITPPSVTLMSVEDEAQQLLQLSPTKAPAVKEAGSRKEATEDENTRGSPLIYSSMLNVVVRRPEGKIGLIFRYTISAFLILMNFGFGCSLDLAIVKKILKRPIAPIIGFLCQFTIMPLLGFAVTQLIPLGKIYGFGLLTLSCCPGGGGSNVWTLLLKGDVNLSITMTFFSLCASIFMMPFWLFLLSRFYIDPAQLHVPYGAIFITLITFVVPCLLGVLIHRKKPRLGDQLARALKPLGILFILFIITFGIYANIYIYAIMAAHPIVIPPSFLLPWLGFLLGFCAARILRQPFYRAVTIAIETGIQNYGIAMVMLQGSFPMPYGDLAATMPLIVGHFTPLPLYICFMALTIRDKCCNKDAKADSEDAERSCCTKFKDCLKEEEEEVIEPEDKKELTSGTGQNGVLVNSGKDAKLSVAPEELNELLTVIEGQSVPKNALEQAEGGWIFRQMENGWVVAKKEPAGDNGEQKKKVKGENKDTASDYDNAHLWDSTKDI